MKQALKMIWKKVSAALGADILFLTIIFDYLTHILLRYVLYLKYRKGNSVFVKQRKKNTFGITGIGSQKTIL
jgi:hypothetical protein